MPVQFLSAQQRADYGRYTAVPTEEELARYFHLDEVDQQRIFSKRGEHNRLGFALQLTTVRYLGRFPDDFAVIPTGVVNFVWKQLYVHQTLDRQNTNLIPAIVSTYLQ